MRPLRVSMTGNKLEHTALNLYCVVKGNSNLNSTQTYYFLRIIDRPSLIGKSTTSNRSSFTTALLNLCIRPASLRALRLFFNALSSRPSSSSVMLWKWPVPKKQIEN